MTVRKTEEYADLCKRFGEAMHEARRKKKISLMALGQELGIAYSAVWGYESGAHLPAVPQMVRVAKALDMSLDEVFL